MIGRLWKTGLKTGRDKAYEAFAREISLPMFKQQEGFLGCVMSHNKAVGFVLTFWRDERRDRSTRQVAHLSRDGCSDSCCGSPG
jgi:heme-degrading monooxygenase HmoA